MLIHIIRHTTPDIAKGICYGQTDLALASSFYEERELLTSKLLESYDAVYTSPLQRCSRLANYIAGQQEPIEEPRILEYNFGDWELHHWDSLTSAAAQKWMDNFIDEPAPNGENMLAMQERVLEFWQELLAKPHSNVAVVTHAGVQRLIHAHILKSPIAHIFRLKIAFGTVFEVRHNANTGFLTIQSI